MNEGEKKKVDRGRGGPKFLFVYYHHYYTDLAVMKRKGTRVIPKAHRRLQSWRGLDLCVRKGSRQETLSSTESSEVSDLLSSFTCAYVYIMPVLLQYQPNQRSFFVVLVLSSTLPRPQRSVLGFWTPSFDFCGSPGCKLQKTTDTCCYIHVLKFLPATNLIFFKKEEKSVWVIVYNLSKLSFTLRVVINFWM